MLWLVIIASVAAAYFAWRVAAIAARRPAVGDAAPDFALPDQSGTTRTLAEFRGRALVLYFFPRADTPG